MSIWSYNRNLMSKGFRIITVLVVVALSVIGCSDSNITCSEKAVGLTIDPDPAFLYQDITIWVSACSGFDVCYLQYITVKDASGNIVKEYETSEIAPGSPQRELPDEISSTGSGWRIDDEFTSGTPGRWNLEGEYSTAMYETETFGGSFCMNADSDYVEGTKEEVIPPGLAPGEPSGEPSEPEIIRIETNLPADCISGGLAWDGSSIWYIDIDTDLIYKIDASNGNVVATFPPPSYVSQGLTYDGRYFWVSTGDGPFGDNKNIIQMDPYSGSIISSFQVPVWNLKGLAWDGRYLWVSSHGTNKVYRFDPTTEELSEYLTINKPSALAWDGTALWVSVWISEGEGPRLVKMDTSTGMISATLPYHSLSLTWDGAYLWLLDSGTGGPSSFLKIKP